MLAKKPYVCLITSQACAVNPALLARTDANGLSILCIAHRIGLGIFQGDERDNEIPGSFGGNILIVRDNILQHICIYFYLIASLLKGNAVYILLLYRIRLIAWVNFNNIIIALAFALQNLQCFVRVAGRNYTVGHLTGN